MFLFGATISFEKLYIDNWYNVRNVEGKKGLYRKHILLEYVDNVTNRNTNVWQNQYQVLSVSILFFILKRVKNTVFFTYHCFLLFVL